MDTSLVSQIVFYAFATITVASAAVVVFSRNLIYSAFGLLFTFFGVAVLYVYLGADFLAAAQMVIYVGGILVLLLFGVMLTHKLYSLDLKSDTFQFVPGTPARPRGVHDADGRHVAHDVGRPRRTSAQSHDRAHRRVVHEGIHTAL